MKIHQTKLSTLIASGVAICIILAVLSITVIRSANQSMVEEHINENMLSMQQSLSRAEKDMESKYKFILSTAETLSNADRNFEYISTAKNLSNLMTGSSFTEMFAISPEGMAYSFDGQKANVKDREYFKRAYSGKSVISDKVIDRFSEHRKEVIVYAAPVISNYRVVAVICGAAPADINMSEYTDNIDSQNSGMYVLDRNGNVIMSSLSNGKIFYNTISQSKYANGKSSDYQLAEALKLDGQDTELGDSYYYAGDITDSLRFVDWLSSSKSTSKIFFKKTLKYNGWSIFYVRSVDLAKSTVTFIIVSRVVLFTVLVIFLVALIVILKIQKKSNDNITALAYRDEITGRANWQKFVSTADTIVNKSSWWSSGYAAMHIDVNRFTLYNDYYGNEAGNRLLKYLAETLDLMSSGHEICARRGSDKFVALWVYSNKESFEARINDLFELLKDGPNSENISLTVGVYPLTQKNESIVHSIDLAKLACEQVVDAKRNSIVYYDEPTKLKLQKEHQLEKLMHKALADNEFKLYIQPKHSVENGKLAGGEALVRWISPSKGFISPGEFIPLFEKNGFVADVDRYILEQLCIFQKKRIDLNLPIVPISVNVSRVQLSNPNLADEILETVDRHKVPHRYIDIELTESACFDDMEVLINTIEKLRIMGFPVSMDDFGSGYSSLNLLKDLTFDTLKIDGEFFRNISDLNRANVVVKNIIELAKSLNMKVVAEGIETREQLEFLKTTDCDLIQGYYYSKPISAGDFETYMKINL